MNYDNCNRGVLFKNKEKQSDKHPDYKGTINVAEDEYFLSAWLKTSKAGEKYMSLSVTPKPVQKSAPKQESKAEQNVASQDDFDDVIPFAFAFLAPAGLAVASAVYFFQPVVA